MLLLLFHSIFDDLSKKIRNNVLEFEDVIWFHINGNENGLSFQENWNNLITNECTVMQFFDVNFKFDFDAP